MKLNLNEIHHAPFRSRIRRTYKYLRQVEGESRQDAREFIAYMLGGMDALATMPAKQD